MGGHEIKEEHGFEEQEKLNFGEQKSKKETMTLRKWIANLPYSGTRI
jgi:hypothetical protein